MKAQAKPVVPLAVCAVKLRTDSRLALRALIAAYVGTDLPRTATAKGFGLRSHHTSHHIPWHLVNKVVMFIHVWPPGLAFTRAQLSLEAPLLEIYILGFFRINTVQNILVLLAAGPVFPAGPVLASLGHSRLADGVGCFFPAPSKALMVAIMQPSTALLLLVTTAQEAPCWNPPPTPAPPPAAGCGEQQL